MLRSPMVIRKDLSATVGSRSTRNTASRRSISAIRKASRGGDTSHHVPVHARRLAEKHLHRHVDGALPEVAIRQRQVLSVGGRTDDRVRTALPLTDGLEYRQPVRVDGQHIALLGLVGPDLHRGHPGLVVRDVAELEASASAGVVDQLGQGVG